MLCQNERVHEKLSYFERGSSPGAACTLACLRASPCLGNMSASLRVWREFLQFLSEQGEILPDVLGHILAIKRRCWVITR